MADAAGFKASWNEWTPFPELLIVLTNGKEWVMPRAKLTSKGQLTIPQLVRETLGLETGDKVDFVADPTGGYRVVPVRKDVRALRGRFAGRALRPVSIEAMAEAVETETAERARRRSSTQTRRR
jgi:AbrB family looped-hinge helix DNA binding protein